MSKKRPTVLVKARPGIVLPIPNGVALNAGSRVFSAETAVEVYADTTFIQRALHGKRPDLTLASKPTKKGKE